MRITPETIAIDAPRRFMWSLLSCLPFSRSLLRDPFAKVRRALREFDASRFAHVEEANAVNVHVFQFVKV